MAKKLFLLDGMALVYRAHFALIARPIFTSKGVNTSALYGFTQTLLDILRNQQPTHLAVAFDTEAPTQRHIEFADYKATRQAMPEDLSKALPDVRRMIAAFNIPTLICDGYEADDIIGTIARRAEAEGFQTYMVTPDKDFGQLVTKNTLLFKPGRTGDASEVLGPAEVCARWGIERPEQVIDILALMGDSSDNIPGVPGIGERTASKLIARFGSVENVLAHAGELSGRVKESLETNRETALLSKRLATLNCEAPCPFTFDALKLRPPHEDQVKSLLIEFEFNSIGRRLFGDDFKAGRGFAEPSPAPQLDAATTPAVPPEAEPSATAESPAPRLTANLKKLADVPHDYRVAASPEERAEVVRLLKPAKGFGFNLACSGSDPKQAVVQGLAFALEPGTGFFVPVPTDPAQAKTVIAEFRSILESDKNRKTGHDLKFVVKVLSRQGIVLGGAVFDIMIAHSLAEPDMRHSLEYLGESLLGYTPMPPVAAAEAASGAGSLALEEALPAGLADAAVERADLALQLQPPLEAMLREKNQERVFYEIESPLMPVLADMELEGIRVDAAALADFAAQLAKELDQQEKTICQLAGQSFNLNSPRQLGQILFETMKIAGAPKKTRTGQYATDEQTLMALAPDHEIVRRLLEYRAAAKLKSTYADALPAAIYPGTGRVHTTYHQVATSTGRLNSQDPNLQNIPIRTERGQEIRKAFVPRDRNYRLLSADYSQIELRIIAALSREPGLLEAFRTGVDVHTVTAAKVYGVFPDLVTPEMRRKAKMVNYGIAYGISAFGLAQRLGIPRREGAEIIDNYFKQFTGIRQYMDDTIEGARRRGYVETVTGRRRYIRDINSANNTVRGAAERNAINAPVQGTAADMIKLAMIHIHHELNSRKLKTRMLLQVHDELVFDLHRSEEAEVRALVEDKMKNAIALEVPIAVEIGVGDNWLEAH